MQRRDAVVSIAVVAAAGLVAVWFGQTAGWDLRNYHLYGAWAWTEGRDALDVAPAQLQGFFNPLLHLELAWLVEHAPPVVVTFVLGALGGCAIPLLAAIARQLLPNGEWRWSWALAIAGGLGATMLGELGATQGDNLLAIPILAAILLSIRTPHRWFAQLAAGVLFGAAVGLKLALAPIAGAFVLALPLLDADARARTKRFAWTTIGGLIAFAATAGPWMWLLHQRYGNPLFPFAAAWFPSPMDIGFVPTDERFGASSLLDVVSLPFRWLVDWRLVSDLKFRDARITLLFACMPFLVAWLVTGRNALDATHRRLAYFAAAFAIGYVGWAVLFGYYRYLAVWECLAPVVVGAFVIARTTGRRSRVALATGVALVVLATNPANWGRVAHGERFVEATLPALAPDTMVLLAGDAPLAYLVRELPEGVPAVRISGNFFGPPRAPGPWDARVAERLAAHGGSLVVLHQARDRTSIDPALARHGLVRGDCEVVATNLLGEYEPPVEACRVSRIE